MCTVLLLPGVKPISVNKYIISIHQAIRDVDITEGGFNLFKMLVENFQ